MIKHNGAADQAGETVKGLSFFRRMGSVSKQMFRKRRGYSTGMFLICILSIIQVKADAPIHRGRSISANGYVRLYFPDDTIAMRHNGAQHLIVECANPTAASLSNYTITLTLPVGYEIINPSGRTFTTHYNTNMPSVSFQTVNNRQVVTLAFANAISPGDIDDNEYYYSTLLIMRALSNASAVGTLDYAYTAAGWTGPSGSMPVQLLPDLPGNLDRPFMLMCPIVGFHANLNSTEATALLQTYKDAGFDTIHVTNYPQSLYDSADPGSWLKTYIPAIRSNIQPAHNLGLKVMYSNFMVWGRDYFEFDGQVSHQAMDPDGNRLERVPCPEWWIDSGYLQHWDAMEYELDVNFADMYLRDSEMNKLTDYCFCTACKTAFGIVENVSGAENMTSSQILANYYDEWVDFRCRQYAGVAQRLREGAYEARPGEPFFVYSGLQYAENLELYCIDWNYMGAACDWAVGTRGSIADTITALNGTPLMGRFGVYDFSPLTHLPIYVETYVDTGATGLRLFCAFNYDGNILQHAAFISNMMARFADIFEAHTVQNNLVTLSGDTTSVEHRVLVSGSGAYEKRLVVLMNNASSARDVLVTCSTAGDGWQAGLYPAEQSCGDGKTTRVLLEPYDVKLIEITHDTEDTESYLLNHSFELTSGSDFTYWNRSYSGYTISTSMSYLGDKSLKFDGHTSTFFAASQSVQVPKNGSLYPNLKVSVKAYVERLDDCRFKPIHISWSSGGQSQYRSIAVTTANVVYDKWIEYSYVLDEFNVYPPDNDIVTFWTLSDNHGANGYVTAYVDEYIIEEADNLAANYSFEKIYGTGFTCWNAPYDGYSVSSARSVTGTKSLLLQGTTSNFLAASQAFSVTAADGLYPDIRIKVKAYVDDMTDCSFKPIHLSWSSGGQPQYRSLAVSPATAVYDQWTEYTYLLNELNVYPPDNDSVTIWTLSDNHGASGYISAYIDDFIIEKVDNLIDNYSFEQVDGSSLTAWNALYDGYAVSSARSVTGTKSLLLQGSTSTFLAASQSFVVEPVDGVHPDVQIKVKAYLAAMTDCRFKPIHLSWSSGGQNQYRSVTVTTATAVYDQWVEYTYLLNDLDTYPPDNNLVTFWILSDEHGQNSNIEAYVDDVKITL